MAEIFLTKDQSGRLAPATEGDLQKIQVMQAGQGLKARVILQRDLQRHRRYFKMLHVMFDSQDHYQNFEHFRAWLIMKAGWVETSVAPNGTVMFFPKSISFENMEEDEFQQLYSACINSFLENLGAGINQDDLLEVISYG